MEHTNNLNTIWILILLNYMTKVSGYDITAVDTCINIDYFVCFTKNQYMQMEHTNNLNTIWILSLLNYMTCITAK